MTDVTEFDPFVEPEVQPKRAGLSVGSIVLLIGVVLVMAVVGWALARQKMTQPEEGVAPKFSVTTFDGQDMSLDGLRGKVVVVNFWASWCGPCRVEAPILQSVWERYQDDDVVILGIAYADSERGSLDFIEEFGITYPNAPDLGTRISDDYNIRGVPETFIIDQNGHVAEFIFAQVTENGLISTIDRLLQAG